MTRIIRTVATMAPSTEPAEQPEDADAGSVDTDPVGNDGDESYSEVELETPPAVRQPRRRGSRRVVTPAPEVAAPAATVPDRDVQLEGLGLLLLFSRKTGRDVDSVVAALRVAIQAYDDMQ